MARNVWNGESGDVGSVGNLHTVFVGSCSFVETVLVSREVLLSIRMVEHPRTVSLPVLVGSFPLPVLGGGLPNISKDFEGSHYRLGKSCQL